MSDKYQVLFGFCAILCWFLSGLAITFMSNALLGGLFALAVLFLFVKAFGVHIYVEQVIEEKEGEE